MKEKLFHHALDVVCEDGTYRPRRFTQKQTDALAVLAPLFGQTSRAAAGISLKCYTSAETVSFSYSLTYAPQRVSGLDVYENGVLFHNELLPEEDTAEARFTYRKQTAGEILLEIVLPGAAEMRFRNLDFGAWRPYDASGKPLVLWYGDSITQSTAVTTPSLTFPALSSRLAEAEYVNRGIGSLYFDASVLDENDPLRPDIIMVELGSNDIVMHDAEKKVVRVDGKVQYCTEEDLPGLMDCAREYLCELRRIYPDARIVVMSMLWDCVEGNERYRQADAIYRVALEKLVRELSLDYIDGLTLMPHLEQCCLEDRTHLSLIGSLATAQSLVKYLKGME